MIPEVEPAIAARIADVFADQDAERMRQLDRLIAAGHGYTDPKSISADELTPPAPAAPPRTRG
jgi:hypothetical protein